jgi:predicted DNA-binding antitoxin AbrB/MazE fold protein
MSHSLKVIYEDGVFKPLQKVNLKEHQKLELIIKKVIEDTPPPPEQESPLRLIGLFDSDIDDLAAHHDTYLYNNS